MIKRSTTKIEWFGASKKRLNEIYQQTGYRFAFFGKPDKNERAQQCHVWVKCRDFLPDAVRATLQNKIFTIYGFTFDPGTDPEIDLATMRMLVHKVGIKDEEIEKFENKMSSSLKLLHHYEEIMEIESSTLFRTKTDYKGNPVYSFVGDVEWLKSPFLISLYTFLIRLGEKEIQFENNEELMVQYKKLIDRYKGGKIYDNDIGYLEIMWDTLHLILLEIRELTNKIDPIFINLDIDNGRFHNFTGIVSLAKANTPVQEINKMAEKYLKKVG